MRWVLRTCLGVIRRYTGFAQTHRSIPPFTFGRGAFALARLREIKKSYGYSRREWSEVLTEFLEYKRFEDGVREQVWITRAERTGSRLDGVLLPTSYVHSFDFDAEKQQEICANLSKYIRNSQRKDYA